MLLSPPLICLTLHCNVNMAAINHNCRSKLTADKIDCTVTWRHAQLYNIIEKWSAEVCEAMKNCWTLSGWLIQFDLEQTFTPIHKSYKLWHFTSVRTNLDRKKNMLSIICYWINSDFKLGGMINVVSAQVLLMFQPRCRMLSWSNSDVRCTTVCLKSFGNALKLQV